MDATKTGEYGDLHDVICTCHQALSLVPNKSFQPHNTDNFSGTEVCQSIGVISTQWTAE